MKMTGGAILDRVSLSHHPHVRKTLQEVRQLLWSRLWH